MIVRGECNVVEQNKKGGVNQALCLKYNIARHSVTVRLKLSGTRIF